MIKFLKDESHYNDLYDLLTIKECLEVTNHWDKLIQEKKLSESIEAKSVLMFRDLQLFYVKGERWKNRSSNVKEWIKNDQKRDEKLEQAREPHNISCPNCAKKMKSSFKTLQNTDIDSLRVMFFFECPSCKKRRGIFEDGQEWVRQSQRMDFDDEAFDKEFKESQMKDKELLEKHRAEFCITDSEGYEYEESCRNLEELKKITDLEDRRQTDPAYQKAMKLKKLTIVELEKIISEAVEKEQYVKLVLDKPEIDKFVIVPFTIQDADPKREKGNSARKLEKTIKHALIETNWRLMSDGVSYRLGYLSGRFKGYEQEEDLVQIVKE